MQFLKKPYSFVIDRPLFVTGLIIVLMIAQFFAAERYQLLSPVRFLDGMESADAPSLVAGIALGVASVASMVGGFAGVVVVFGLSANDERFRAVRLKAATSLRRNWMAVITIPLFAAFAALFAAAAASSAHFATAMWIVEGALLFAGHGALRLVALLHELVRVVHASDVKVDQEQNTMTADDIYGPADS